MKSDIDIKRDLEEELRLNPDIDATDIAVAVKNGVVLPPEVRVDVAKAKQASTAGCVVA